MPIVWLLFFTFFVYPSKHDEENSIQSIKLILRTITTERKTNQEKLNHFRIDNCQDPKINWAQILTSHSQASIKFKFKEGCDLNGEINPQFIKPFKINLDLRNLFHFTTFQSDNQISAILERHPILKLEITNGLLKGLNSEVKFNANYSIRIKSSNEMTKAEYLEGEIIITEINSRKIKIIHKIK